MLHGIDAARLANGVQLINENNARRFLLRLLEQVTHPRGTDTNEHLHKVRTAKAEKWHGGLASDSSRQQGFSRSRRAYQQNPLGDTPAEVGILLRITQEIDNFLQFLFRLIGSGNIGKRTTGLAFGVNSRPAFAEIHHALTRAKPSGEEGPEQEQQSQWQDP